MTCKEFQLYSDGGARGNPGIAGIGAVLYGKDGEVLFKKKQYIGTTTNNQAEYRAMILGLEETKMMFVPEKITCYADSELMIKQLNGEYKVKNKDLLPLFQKIKKIVSDFPYISFKHIPRSKNTVADKLANEAMDQRK